MSWKPEYVVLILLSTVIDYFSARQMEKCADRSQRRRYLLLSLCSNLGVLFGFKYFNFFNDSIRYILNQINIMYAVPNWNVLLPVGISFYTFQTLSYSIDVYRGKRKAEKHFGIFALYVSFFPQLVAGPIERSEHLLPQFHIPHNFDYERITSGLKLMAWGFFKKLVIADRLAVFVNPVYNNPEQQNSFALIVATYFFAFQILCDFSGYSDIAIGASRVLGFDLMQNFRQPYLSKSVREFWQRWHISLSTWFRDYLYFPLGGNRVTLHRWCINILVVFLVSGLWHGANWTFVVWGGLHGVYLVAERLLSKFIPQKPSVWIQFLKTIFTFHLVLFAWIFFRANSLPDATYIIRHLFSTIDVVAYWSSFGLNMRVELIISTATILLLLIIQQLQQFVDIGKWVNECNNITRWGLYYLAVMSILILGKFGSDEFIYFQF